MTRALGADRRRVREVGGEPAAEIALSARPTEHLVMGRQQLDVAAGVHPQLHARAAHLDAGDAFLDDAAALGELVEVCVERRVAALELHLPQACDDLGSLVRVARRRETARSTMALP